MCGSRLNRLRRRLRERTPWGEVKITAAARPRSMSMASSAAKIAPLQDHSCPPPYGTSSTTA